MNDKNYHEFGNYLLDIFFSLLLQLLYMCKFTCMTSEFTIIYLIMNNKIFNSFIFCKLKFQCKYFGDLFQPQ